MAKLTLSVNDAVVARAKLYAKRHGTSVSAMIEAYLRAVEEPASPVARDTPILRSLRGALRKGDHAAYKRYLAEKYR